MGDPATAETADLLKGGMAAVATSLDELEKRAAEREARLGRAATVIAAAGLGLLVVAWRIAAQRHRMRQPLS